MVQPNAPVEIYQLQILLLQINPPIWRRLHVRSDSSIAVARLAPDRIRLERLSPPPFCDSWQGVRREPDGLHHVTTAARKVLLSQFRFRSLTRKRNWLRCERNTVIEEYPGNSPY
jgi:hypothetical protein